MPHLLLHWASVYEISSERKVPFSRLIQVEKEIQFIWSNPDPLGPFTRENDREILKTHFNTFLISSVQNRLAILTKLGSKYALVKENTNKGPRSFQRGDDNQIAISYLRHIGTALVVQLVKSLASHAEGWVFESQPRQT